MKCIYVDSTNANMCVIAINDDKVEYKTSGGVSLKHNDILLPYLDEVLQKVGMDIANVEYVACSVGAGSFTGIRLGVTTCNGIAFASGAKRIAMNTFSPFAYNSKGKLLVLIDARHGNYYGAEYLDGEEIRLGNYTQNEVDSYQGKTIIIDGQHNIENIIARIKEKISKSDFTNMLVPMYLKASQAEREINANSKSC